jgi:transposase InsO family protein
MAVNNQNQPESSGDYRSGPRWSAGKKMDAVLRLLRGEPLEALSRELGVEAHRLAAWRDDFLERGKQGLKGQRPDRSPDDRALRQVDRRAATRTDRLHQRRRPAGADPARPARLAICRGGLPQAPGSAAPPAPGPGERQAGPAAAGSPRTAGSTTGPWPAQAAAHDGTIIPQAPNQRWGTDATMAWTRADGWVWVFAGIDHYTAQAWAHVAKVGDRFAALQPVYDAVIDRWGRLGPDLARGLELRHDGGPQYRSAHFTGSLAWLGITDSPALLGEPETNGCAERWIGTLKDQCLWVQLHDTVEELRQAVAGFVDRYNSSWLIQRHGHRTPKEAYQPARSASAA